LTQKIKFFLQKVMATFLKVRLKSFYKITDTISFSTILGTPP